MKILTLPKMKSTLMTLVALFAHPVIAQEVNPTSITEYNGIEVVLDSAEIQRLESLRIDFDSFKAPMVTDGIFEEDDLIAIDEANRALSQRITAAIGNVAMMYRIALRLKQNLDVEKKDRTQIKDSFHERIYQAHQKKFQEQFNQMINHLTYLNKDSKSDPLILAVQKCKRGVCVTAIRNQVKEILKLGFAMNQDLDLSKLSKFKVDLKLDSSIHGLTFKQAFDRLIPPNQTRHAGLILAGAAAPFVVALSHSASIGEKFVQLFTNLEVRRSKLYAKSFNEKSWRKKSIENVLIPISEKLKALTDKEFTSAPQAPTDQYQGAPNPTGKAGPSTQEKAGPSTQDTAYRLTAGEKWDHGIGKTAEVAFFLGLYGRLNQVGVDRIFTRMKQDGKTTTGWMNGLSVQGAAYSMSDSGDSNDISDDAVVQDRSARASFLPFRLSLGADGTKRIEVSLYQWKEMNQKPTNDHWGEPTVPSGKFLNLVWDDRYSFLDLSTSTLKFFEVSWAPVWGKGAYLSPVLGGSLGMSKLNQNHIQGTKVPFTNYDLASGDADIDPYARPNFGQPEANDRFKSFGYSNPWRYQHDLHLGLKWFFTNQSQKWHFAGSHLWEWREVKNMQYQDQTILIQNQENLKKYKDEVAAFPDRYKFWEGQNFLFDQAKAAWVAQNYPGQNVPDSVYTSATGNARPVQPVESTGGAATNNPIDTLKNRFSMLRNEVDISYNPGNKPNNPGNKTTGVAGVGIRLQYNPILKYAITGQTSGYAFDLTRDYRLPFQATMYLRF